MIKEEIHMIKEEIEKAINPVLDEGDIPIEFIGIAKNTRDFSHGMNWQIYLTVYTYLQWWRKAHSFRCGMDST